MSNCNQCGQKLRNADASYTFRCTQCVNNNDAQKKRDTPTPVCSKCKAEMKVLYRTKPFSAGYACSTCD